MYLITVELYIGGAMYNIYLITVELYVGGAMYSIASDYSRIICKWSNVQYCI